MIIKYYPQKGSPLFELGLHLFEGVESSYWAILKKNYNFIYRFNEQNWKALSLEEIDLIKIKEFRFDFEVAKNELKYINEYKEALKIHKKYSSLL